LRLLGGSLVLGSFSSFFFFLFWHWYLVGLGYTQLGVDVGRTDRSGVESLAGSFPGGRYEQLIPLEVVSSGRRPTSLF
jgi:hypothetical protein